MDSFDRLYRQHTVASLTKRRDFDQSNISWLIPQRSRQQCTSEGSDSSSSISSNYSSIHKIESPPVSPSIQSNANQYSSNVVSPLSAHEAQRLARPEPIKLLLTGRSIPFSPQRSVSQHSRDDVSTTWSALSSGGRFRSLERRWLRTACGIIRTEPVTYATNSEHTQERNPKKVAAEELIVHSPSTVLLSPNPSTDEPTDEQPKSVSQSQQHESNSPDTFADSDSPNSSAPELTERSSVSSSDLTAMAANVQRKTREKTRRGEKGGNPCASLAYTRNHDDEAKAKNQSRLCFIEEERKDPDELNMLSRELFKSAQQQVNLLAQKTTFLSAIPEEKRTGKSTSEDRKQPPAESYFYDSNCTPDLFTNGEVSKLSKGGIESFSAECQSTMASQGLLDSAVLSLSRSFCSDQDNQTSESPIDFNSQDICESKHQKMAQENPQEKSISHYNNPGFETEKGVEAEQIEIELSSSSGCSHKSTNGDKSEQVLVPSDSNIPEQLSSELLTGLQPELEKYPNTTEYIDVAHSKPSEQDQLGTKTVQAATEMQSTEECSDLDSEIDCNSIPIISSATKLHQELQETIQRSFDDADIPAEDLIATKRSSISESKSIELEDFLKDEDDTASPASYPELSFAESPIDSPREEMDNGLNDQTESTINSSKYTESESLFSIDSSQYPELRAQIKSMKNTLDTTMDHIEQLEDSSKDRESNDDTDSFYRELEEGGNDCSHWSEQEMRAQEEINLTLQDNEVESIDEISKGVDTKEGSQKSEALTQSVTTDTDESETFVNASRDQNDEVTYEETMTAGRTSCTSSQAFSYTQSEKAYIKNLDPPKRDENASITSYSVHRFPSAKPSYWATKVQDRVSDLLGDQDDGIVQEKTVDEPATENRLTSGDQSRQQEGQNKAKTSLWFRACVCEPFKYDDACL